MAVLANKQWVLKEELVNSVGRTINSTFNTTPCITGSYCLKRLVVARFYCVKFDLMQMWNGESDGPDKKCPDT
jgi:hypothetical protein